MTRLSTVILVLVAAAIAILVIAVASWVTDRSPHHPRPRRTGAASHRAALTPLTEGRDLAALANARARQLHDRMRLTPVHCAADGVTYACSFHQTGDPHGCRFVRFQHKPTGEFVILLAGWVSRTFCQAKAGVA